MSPARSLLATLAVIGNGLFIVWMVVNGINEGFKATPVQIASYLGLACLLLLNSWLIIRRRS